MRFVVAGTDIDVTARDIEARLNGVVAEPVRQLGVRVNGTVFPVKQALEVAAGMPRARFTSHAARRVLDALGFELVGDIEPRTPLIGGARTARTDEGVTDGVAADDVAVEGAWCREADVQAAVVAHLRAQGWVIVSTADTARRERGIDVVAVRDGVTVAVEVKGYPERRYADPARSAETKPTHPSNQARHWYAQAILTAMITRSERPDDRSVIALPDVPRYRGLHRRTRPSLDACGISVWWVASHGGVSQ